MNNLVSDKTLENLRNRIDARLASIEKVFLKWTSKQAICHEQCLIMIQLRYVKV